MKILRLSETLRERIETWVTDGYPFETCGLLIGCQSHGQTEIVDVTHARNLNQERAQDRYELNPEDFLAADHAARQKGLEIVGIWHSHPDHPARPSEMDREAAWEGWSYMIAEVRADGMADLRSWRLAGEQFIEEKIQMSEEFA